MHYTARFRRGSRVARSMTKFIHVGSSRSLRVMNRRDLCVPRSKNMQDQMRARNEPDAARMKHSSQTARTHRIMSQN
jgi:hypothetical protein